LAFCEFYLAFGSLKKISASPLDYFQSIQVGESFYIIVEALLNFGGGGFSHLPDCIFDFSLLSIRYKVSANLD